MPYTQQNLTTPDGLTLRAGMWLPEGTPRAMLTLCHGHSEHLRRYAYLAGKLNRAGCGLCMAELRGHGESEGQRGHINAFDEYIADFETMLNASRIHQPGVPHFLGGHSMGGLIAAHYTLGLDSDYAGLLLSSAWLATAVDVSPVRLAAARVLSRIWPRFSQQTGLDDSLLSHDETIVATYQDDPLVHGMMSARAFAALSAAQEEVLAEAEHIMLPLYVIHGSQDTIATPQATRRLYERASSRDKTYELYEGLYHELFNEIERDAVIDDLVAWLKERET